MVAGCFVSFSGSSTGASVAEATFLIFRTLTGDLDAVRFFPRAFGWSPVDVAGTFCVDLSFVVVVALGI